MKGQLLGVETLVCVQWCKEPGSEPARGRNGRLPDFSQAGIAVSTSITWGQSLTQEDVKVQRGWQLKARQHP